MFKSLLNKLFNRNQYRAVSYIYASNVSHFIHVDIKSGEITRWVEVVI